MNKQNSTGQFGNLGKRLRDLRSRAKETLAEVSGAVEIDVQDLVNFELGHARPSEEILLLLISHFGAGDEEALKLWETAGYGTIYVADKQPALDNKVMFTDSVDIVVNNYGVVMNFMQGAGANHPQQCVARVGMSREHAKSVMQILKMTLEQTEKHQQRQVSQENSQNDN